MTRGIAIAAVWLLALSGFAAAQQVGDNVNILPVYKSTPDGEPPATMDYLKGNLLGQRCNEPSIIASSVNKDHLIAFCNDYRGASNWDDLIVPAGRTSIAARLWNGVRTFMARLVGKPILEHDGDRNKEVEASAEAGIGGAVSYDRGLTWTGFMVAGGPNDSTPASLVHPGRLAGLQGYSDPYAFAMACGRVGLAYIGFTRDQRSMIFFTLFQDRNDSDVRHTWEYKYTTMVDQANNALNGQFLDKVSAVSQFNGVADCNGTPPPERINITYTRFTGGSSKFNSNIVLATSNDLGKIFTLSFLDQNAVRGQATVAVVNPVTNELDVAWRTYNPDRFIIKRVVKNAKNVEVLGADPAPYNLLAKFDQPSVLINPTQSASKEQVAFRSGGFPAMAYSADGTTLMMVWHELINRDTMQPYASTSPAPASVIPMIVMKYSKDYGDTWSPRVVLASANPSSAEGWPVNPPSPEKLGFFNPEPTLVGPQLQPAIGCTVGGTCIVTWYESRDPKLSANGWVAGYERLLDVRAALIHVDAASRVPTPQTSFQVSRYGYRQLQDEEKPSDITDYLTATSAGFAFPLLDSTNDYPRLYTSGGTPDNFADKLRLPNGNWYERFNAANRNHTSAGYSAFIGDYMDVEPLVSVVKGADGKWRYAQSPDDVPSGTSFVTAFVDNRDNVQAYQSGTWNSTTGTWSPGVVVDPGQEWKAYPVYQTDSAGITCINYGSRVQNTMTAQINADVVITSETNYKPFPATQSPKACNNGTQACIEFPTTIWNKTGTRMRFQIDAVATGSGTSGPSFAKNPDSASPPYYPYPLNPGWVYVAPYSSYSFNVYAFDARPVTVKVSECDNPDPVGTDPVACTGAPTLASVTYNAPGSVAAVAAPAPAYAPSTVQVTAPSQRYPSQRYPSQRYATPISNPVPDDPLPTTGPDGNAITVYDIIDYSVTVTPTSSQDAGSYLTRLNIDPAYAQDYIFQAFVMKPLTAFNPGQFGQPDQCGVGNRLQGSLVGHVSDPSNPLANPSQRYPSQKYPTQKYPSQRYPTQRYTVPYDGDAVIQNTTFTLATSTADNLPTTSSGILGPTLTGCNAVGGGIIDQCMLAAPRLPAEVTITLRAYQITPTAIIEAEGRPIYDPYNTNPEFATPPSIGVAEYSCNDPSCIYVTGPDLVVQAPPSETYSPAKVAPQGSSVTFPTNVVTVQNLGVECTGGTISCATARAHRWGIFISQATTLDQLPPFTGDTIVENMDPTTGPITKLLKTGNVPSLANNGSELIDPGPVTIPSDIPVGTYYLYLYVDDTRVVSEIDETNNYFQGGPIEVVQGAYGFIGLQSPCDEGKMTCTKSGNGAVVLAWQFSLGGGAVDTQTVDFAVRFYACSTTVDPNSPDTGMLQISRPDPTTVTTGSSGFQYFTLATATIRPAYTWQFNWDRPNPPFTGPCYNAYIEVNSTGQVFGSTGQPIGPITITLR